MQNKQSAEKVPKKPQPKGGSRKGKPNKVSKALKDMVLGALDDCGGQNYLAEQARENPAAFMSLLGKTMPKAVDMNIDAKVDQQISVVERHIVKAENKNG